MRQAFRSASNSVSKNHRRPCVINCQKMFLCQKLLCWLLAGWQNRSGAIAPARLVPLNHRWLTIHWFALLAMLRCA
jgi:hypothetical protein